MENPIMTRLRAYEIAGNPDDIIATHAGPDTMGRYYGFITRGKIGRYQIIFATTAIFDTAEAADDAMCELIAALTLWHEDDIKDPKNTAVNLITGQESSVIRKIVAAATKVLARPATLLQ